MLLTIFLFYVFPLAIRAACLSSGTCAKYEAFGSSDCSLTSTSMDVTGICMTQSATTWAVCNDQNTEVHYYHNISGCDTSVYVLYGSGLCNVGTNPTDPPSYKWTCLGPVTSDGWKSPIPIKITFALLVLIFGLNVI